MHTGAVLALDDGPFAADRLDRIETAVPDAHAGEGEGSDEAAFHIDEEFFADHHGHEAGDDCRHGQDLPVVLIDEETELLAQIDPNLACAPCMVDFAGFFGFNRIDFRHAAPPHSCYPPFRHTS